VLAGLPVIKRDVSIGLLRITNQFGGDVALPFPKKVGPRAIGCVGAFEGTPLGRLDAELPDDHEAGVTAIGDEHVRGFGFKDFNRRDRRGHAENAEQSEEIWMVAISEFRLIS
jgi:hypothetical protein